MNSLGWVEIAQIVEHGASNAKIMGSIPRKARADQI